LPINAIYIDGIFFYEDTLENDDFYITGLGTTKVRIIANKRNIVEIGWLKALIETSTPLATSTPLITSTPPVTTTPSTTTTPTMTATPLFNEIIVRAVQSHKLGILFTLVVLVITTAIILTSVKKKPK